MNLGASWKISPFPITIFPMLIFHMRAPATHHLGHTTKLSTISYISMINS